MAVAGGALAPVDQIRILERLEPLRQQAARYQRHAVQDLAEAEITGEELADDEERPPLSDDLQRHRHRTKLTVHAHAAQHAEGAAHPQPPNGGSPFFELVRSAGKN